MATLTFHPGLGKTGTSAIQSISSKLLDGRDGVRYCPVGLNGNLHNAWAITHPSYSEANFEAVESALRELSQDCDYVVSSEFLCWCPDEHVCRILNAVMTAGFDAQVFFVVRRPSELLLSSYLQALKSGHNLQYGESFEEYVDRVASSFDYHRLVARWTQQSANADVNVIEYSVDGAHIERFFELLGVVCEFAATKQRVNRSLLPEVAPLLAEFDRGRAETVDVNDWDQERSLLVEQLMDVSVLFAPYSRAPVLDSFEQLDERYNAFLKSF